jgi:hypothetical protein
VTFVPEHGGHWKATVDTTEAVLTLTMAQHRENIFSQFASIREAEASTGF